MDDIRLALTVEYGAEANLSVDDAEGVTLSIGDPYVDGHAQKYEGPYIVRPAPGQAQVLGTEGLLMEEDVTVEEIPYYLTTNIADGYTAIIGD